MRRTMVVVPSLFFHFFIFHFSFFFGRRGGVVLFLCEKEKKKQRVVARRCARRSCPLLSPLSIPLFLSLRPFLFLKTHPVMSSCATAARAIMTAVGFWICISRRRTLPSLVSLMPVGREGGSGGGGLREREKGERGRARRGKQWPGASAAEKKKQGACTGGSAPTRTRSLSLAQQGPASRALIRPGGRGSGAGEAKRGAARSRRSTTSAQSKSPSRLRRQSLLAPPPNQNKQRTARAVHQHLDRARRPQVGGHHVAQPLGGVDRHEERGRARHDFGLGVERLDGAHGGDESVCAISLCACPAGVGACAPVGGWVRVPLFPRLEEKKNDAERKNERCASFQCREWGSETEKNKKLPSPHTQHTHARRPGRPPGRR
jgi:hypothetical protein